MVLCHALFGWSHALFNYSVAFFFQQFPSNLKSRHHSYYNKSAPKLSCHNKKYPFEYKICMPSLNPKFNTTYSFSFLLEFSPFLWWNTCSHTSLLEGFNHCGTLKQNKNPPNYFVSYLFHVIRCILSPCPS